LIEVADLAHVEGTSLGSGEAPHGPDCFGGKAECPDEVAAGTGGDHAQDGFGVHGGVLVQQTVHNLVHRAVPSHGHHEAATRLDGSVSQSGGVPRPLGDANVVLQIPLPQGLLDGGKLLAHAPPARPRVDDQGETAEGTAHGKSVETIRGGSINRAVSLRVVGAEVLFEEPEGLLTGCLAHGGRVSVELQVMGLGSVAAAQTDPHGARRFPAYEP